MATEYYVDPDVAGGGNGSASTPWQKLDTGTWTTINSALASDDVTIYFSARAAGSDTDQASTDTISINRTDGSTNRLTFDGMSKYNTDDATPSWASYAGASRFKITGSTPMNTGTTKRNYVTIKGMKLIATGFQIIRYWGGDHIVIEDCDLSKTAGTTGPGLSIGYAEFVSKASPGPCLDITIKNNTIHDIFWGEACYIGGVEGQNKPGHDGVVIEGNTIYDTATSGAEPDLIDIKDGVRNLEVRDNTLYFTTENTGRDGITTLSTGTFERNFIYNCGRNGITFGSAWNVYPNRDGAICRNNIIINCGGNTAYGWDYGILVADAASGDQWTNLQMYGNTVYTTNGTGISISSNATVSLFSGNTIAESSSWQFISSLASLTGSHDYNNFYKTSGGNLVSAGSNYTAANITSFEANSKAVDPDHVDTSTTPYTAANFKLNSTSPLIEAGPTTIAAWTDDHFKTGRPQGSAEDIGAHEFTGAMPAPTFSSGEVGNVSTTLHVVTFSKVINSPGGNYALGFTSSIGSISSAARGTNQATIEFTVATAAVESDSPTIAYNAAVGDIETQDATPVALATFSAQALTNNVNDAAPSFSSASVLPAANTIDVTHSENLSSPTDDYLTGYSIEINASPATLSGGELQADNSVVRLMYTPLVKEGDTVTVSYNQTLGDIQDQHATNPSALTTYSNQSVTNNIMDDASGVVISSRLRLKPGM